MSRLGHRRALPALLAVALLALLAGCGSDSSGESNTDTQGSIPDAYQDFKFTGLDCTAALAVAQAWDANGKTCNTVDNPDSPIGPQRTCTVNGYSCTAKRDIHSD